MVCFKWQMITWMCLCRAMEMQEMITVKTAGAAEMLLTDVLTASMTV